MTPLIRHLQETFPELSIPLSGQIAMNWTFKKDLKKLGPDFYRKIIPLHLVMNLEYSLLGQQLRAKFLSKQAIDQEELKEQLFAALIMAELLEEIYEHYLIIPREVTRLGQQQNLYRELLELIGAPPQRQKKVEDSTSFTQQIRNTTLEINLYRLLLIRSKRALDLLALLNTSSESYRHFVRIMGKLMDPILTHLSWFFWLPRLLVNLFVVTKHTLPGWWMENEEYSLGWSVRLSAQIKRRWFELGNDIAWVGAGLVNCFILTGALAPWAIYVSLAVFAFDVIMAMTRAYIELSRLNELRTHYSAMLNNPSNAREYREIKEHIKAIDNQIAFERFRLGSHVTTTTLIFLAMCCALPMFAANPIIPFIAAMCLVTICLVNFALTEQLNQYRPKDTIDRSVALAKLGFFSKKEQPTVDLDLEHGEEDDLSFNNSLCYV
ncbi:hypothetical protein [Fluoribacter gormanii]|uniref:Coiled-coil protein n=1 Tax=Fluoribacter gormanii TaxID=464 RepID=A0A377GN50_9GAMM|nr:hypothetical protein [Fluoribacter gormanii]KTD04770.1 hypothetical protein Lgor_0852 [Fluoribacter gormanii]SIR16230.1 hypothetical protein SAMN05421777_10785 [Fluoribacter gormanii]STO26230.1 Uncharacterised protein [Fluoribacter gormanii]